MFYGTLFINVVIPIGTNADIIQNRVYSDLQTLLSQVRQYFTLWFRFNYRYVYSYRIVSYRIVLSIINPNLTRLSNKLLEQGYVKERLKLSLRKFGVACRQGTLTPPDTWSRPFGTCIYSACWDQSFTELVVILPDYALRISLGTFSILLNVAKFDGWLWLIRSVLRAFSAIKIHKHRNFVCYLNSSFGFNLFRRLFWHQNSSFYNTSKLVFSNW